MEKWRVPVGHVKISPLARRYVNQVLSSGRLAYGPFLQRFEREFAALHDSEFAITSNSGTSALHVAIEALKELHGWKRGDEILVPAVTFVATFNMVKLAGLRPVLVDVDPKTYNISPPQIQRHITKRTRAIIPVHLFGQPANMPAIMEVAKSRGLYVIEDSCETMAAKVGGKPVGSWGDIGCFSTYTAHLIVTGVGGINTTSNPVLSVMMRSLVNHGRDGIYNSIDERGAQVIAGRFRFVRPGFSYRITEMEGALGCAQLSTLGKNLGFRIAYARRLRRLLAPLADKLQLPAEMCGANHVYMMFPIVLSPGIPRTPLTLFLENRGIETRHMLPLTNQPYIEREYGDLRRKYPVAHRINESGFYVGCHPGLKLQDADYVADSFRDYFRGEAK